MTYLDHALREARATPLGPRPFGKVRSATGIVVEATGLEAAIGETCLIRDEGGGPSVEAEVIGVRGSAAVLMPLGDATGPPLALNIQRICMPK